mmetsp:Transcript_6867/g.14104  ORF Transcript_6867/g.14104 Transcript_6867/m.14104 type:complete len:99 (-) Transcript_6867:389-685(-)
MSILLVQHASHVDSSYRSDVIAVRIERALRNQVATTFSPSCPYKCDEVMKIVQRLFTCLFVKSVMAAELVRERAVCGLQCCANSISFTMIFAVRPCEG